MFPSKPPLTLRQQSTPLSTSFNGLAGLQCLNPQKYVKPKAVYSSNKNYLRKDDSAESGSDSAHRTSSANSTKLHVNSNSFSQVTTTPASSTIYKTSPLQHPLTTPYGKLSRGSNISLRHPPYFKQLKAFGHIPTSPKLMPSPTIQHLFFSHTPPTYLMRRNPSSVFWNPLTNSNKPKFKQSSTTFLPKLPLATTSSRVKSSKNYLLLASNTSPNFSMLPSSSDTSPTNEKLLKSSYF
jgi:hypothetical protein